MCEHTDNHRWYAIVTRDPEILQRLQWCVFPGQVLSRENVTDLFGMQGIAIELLVTPDEDYDAKVTLDAFYAMGARVLCALPKRKRPPEDNTKPGI